MNFKIAIASCCSAARATGAAAAAAAWMTLPVAWCPCMV